MNSIQISDIRISGFRGFEDVELPLSQTTVLVGCNNAGKTSILKALQLALGSTTFLSQEDLFISETHDTKKIVIDIKFISVADNGNQIENFDENWETVFQAENIQYDENGNAYVAIRSEFLYSKLKSDFEKTTSILTTWIPPEGTAWQDISNHKKNINRESIPFYYIEAQRDIVEDIKLRNSFLGKMLSNISKTYPPEKITEIESQIQHLNETTISESKTLTNIQEILKGIESTIDYKDAEVRITPFTKKIRDLSKGLSIQYGKEANCFTMDYHGMGTRSWSSLLTFKAFIQNNNNSIEQSDHENIFFPIITIEEPEAHLHPDAQKKLYSQISQMPGQKIISTHSPYIAACAQINEIRCLYKNDSTITIGQIRTDSLDQEELRKLNQKVFKTKGEILFSKVLVFFEGETESQALPVFADKYFDGNSIRLEIDFVSVDGCGNYAPFIQLAESFNIPWYIFSDGEIATQEKVLKAIKKVKNAPTTILSEQTNVFIIDKEGDFEQMLIDDDYISDIEESLTKILHPDSIQDKIDKLQGTSSGRIKTESICNACHQNIFEDKFRDYTNTNGYKKALLELMTFNKTALAPIIADQIVNSEKGIPPLVLKVFEKIKEDLSI